MTKTTVTYRVMYKRPGKRWRLKLAGLSKRETLAFIKRAPKKYPEAWQGIKLRAERVTTIITEEVEVL